MRPCVPLIDERLHLNVLSQIPRFSFHILSLSLKMGFQIRVEHCHLKLANNSPPEGQLPLLDWSWITKVLRLCQPDSDISMPGPFSESREVTRQAATPNGSSAQRRSAVGTVTRQRLQILISPQTASQRDGDTQHSFPPSDKKAYPAKSFDRDDSSRK
jgi:hypothetical protein